MVGDFPSFSFTATVSGSSSEMGHSDVIDKKIVDHLKATDLPWLRY
jgi:hypothetical protein